MPTVEIDTDKLAAWAASHLSPDDGTDGSGGGTDGDTAPSTGGDGDAGGSTDDRYQFSGEGFTVTSTRRTPPMTYRFTVDGEVPGGESLEDADSITENDDGTYQVEGTVGPKGSDTYYLHGPIADWTTEDQNNDGVTVAPTRFDVLVGGEPMDLWRVLGGDEPEYDDTAPEAIGGGEAYSQTVTEADADVVAASHGELRTALANAESGDVVFVPGDADLYSPSKDERYVLPGGVTLASDRGVNGSDGALLHTDAAYSYGAEGLVSARGDDARVVGLRVRGPHPQSEVRWRDHSYDYEMSGINARKHGAARLEVDNCEVWGFAHAVAAGENAHVHHNDLSANMKGLGYCTSIGGTEGTVFEYNYCHHWRHVIAGSGRGGYEARFNLIDGPALAHAFDQHAPGGTYSDIHHNTMRVRAADVESSDDEVPFATFRGSNVRQARVYKNWSVHNSPVRETPSEYFTDEFVTHPKHGGTGWTDIKWWDNHIGEGEPDSLDVGCPR